MGLAKGSEPAAPARDGAFRKWAWAAVLVLATFAVRYREAAGAFATALSLDANSTVALAHAALIMAASPDDSLRDPRSALEIAQRADQLAAGRDLQTLRTLAAAYAENGQFPNAEQTIQRALALIAEANKPELKPVLLRDLELYQAGQPFRLPASR